MSGATIETLVHAELAARRRRLARRMVFAGCIVLVAGLFIGARDVRTIVLSYGSLVLGTMLSWVGVMLMDRWNLPPKAEDALPAAMGASNRGWKLYHWALPADHVLQAPWGLVVLDPFNFDGALHVRGAHWRDRRSILRKVFSLGRRSVRDPDRFLALEAEALRSALVEADPRWAELPIERAMVLTHPRARLDAEEPSVPVYLAADLRRGLRTAWRHKALEPAEQRALRDTLDALAAVQMAGKAEAVAGDGDETVGD